MSGKFMTVKKILIPTLTMVLIASQLVGCGATSQKELLQMMQNQQTICIEVPIPKDELSYKDIKYEWIELAQLQTYEQFRQVFDDTYGITTFGTDGKNGVAYIDTEGYHTDNSTLLYAFNNQKFVDLYKSTETTEALREALLSTYTDLDEKSSDKILKIAYLNAYFNIFPDINSSNFDGSDALTRMEYLAGVYRACQPVSALETYEDLAAYVDPEYENPDTIFALQMADLSYLKIEDGDLNESTYNKGSITRAEAVYTLVQLFYADEYEEVQGKDKAFSDTKNGGNLAKKYKFQDQFCERSYTLYKAIEDEKLPEDLYKAMVVAKNHKIITGDTSRWSEGITKGEALQMLVNVFTDLGAELNLDRGEQSKADKNEAAWETLGENQECLTLGSEHLKRLSKTENGKKYVSFDYDVEFIDSLYMINDGWFQGCSKEDLIKILSVALVELPDNATGKEVYDALCNYTTIVNRDAVVTGEGTDVLEGLIQTDPEPNQNNQSSNNNNSNANQNNNNKNNNNSNNSTPSQPSQEEDSESSSSNIPGRNNGPSADEDPDDNRIVEDDDEIFG